MFVYWSTVQASLILAVCFPEACVFALFSWYACKPLIYLSLFWEVKDSKLGEIWHGMEKPGVGELR